MRAYYVYLDCGEGGIGIVAGTAREAKTLAFGNENLMDAEWIEIRVKWKRNVSVTGLPKGEIDLMEGLTRGLYGWIYGETCPVCHEYGEEGNPLVFDSGIVRCQECEDKRAVL